MTRPESTAVGFYEALADDYDAMIRFPERLDICRPVADSLVTRFGIATAVDAGCGTGLYAIAMALAGVTVTGIDPSPAMVARAEQHGRDVGAAIRWRVGGLADLPGLAAHQDAVVCLGNTLPHLRTPQTLESGLRGCAACLRPGGVAIFELVNIPRLRELGERIVGIRRSGNREFLRFYDFDGPEVVFNLLRIDWEEKQPSHTLQSTRLRIYSPQELDAALRRAGFDTVRFHGSLAWTPFNPEESPNLVVVAHRSGQPARGG